jgi:hypothetical protein
MISKKKALEMRMRDALDGMEELASMYSYCALPTELELMEVEDETVQSSAPGRNARIYVFPSIQCKPRTNAKQSDMQPYPDKKGKDKKINIL